MKKKLLKIAVLTMVLTVISIASDEVLPKPISPLGTSEQVSQ